MPVALIVYREAPRVRSVCDTARDFIGSKEFMHFENVYDRYNEQ